VADSESSGGSSGPALVLVVDDDEYIVRILSEVLLDEGYRVVAAHDGAEAIALVRRERPDVVLLDLMMPNVSGWSFLDMYRRTPPPHAPVIVVSAIPPSALKLPEEDVREVVRKPFSVDRLLEVVATTTGRDAGSAPDAP
jgi:CheY-like chemotaxis protein